MSEKPFFIGFLPPPADLRRFLVGFGVLFTAAFALTAWWIGTTQADPGEGAFRFDYGRQTVTGLMEAKPYPMLHVVEGTERIPASATGFGSSVGVLLGGIYRPWPWLRKMPRCSSGPS